MNTCIEKIETKAKLQPKTHMPKYIRKKAL